jgi:O-6-methylguanine DNA methyltransferase
VLELRRSRFPSPLGDLHLVCEDDALVSLDFDDYESRLRELLRHRYGEVKLIKGAVPQRVRDALNAYFAGDIRALEPLPIRLGGTEFQRLVWGGLRGIEAGTIMTYGELARKLGLSKPESARAVGHANSQNPIAIVVPCHRVIGANGKLTGYAGGLNRKEWLLKHEGALLI